MQSNGVGWDGGKAAGQVKGRDTHAAGAVLENAAPPRNIACAAAIVSVGCASTEQACLSISTFKFRSRRAVWGAQQPDRGAPLLPHARHTA